MECSGAQPHTSQHLFLLSEAEKVWTAFAKVLKSQLIQNVSTLIPKFGVLWMESRLLVTDGPLKYYQRVVKFGFLQTFMTTYDLDSVHVPSEAAKRTSTAERLPLDLITEFSGVGAHAANHILHEVFRYIGEALYNGRVLNLEFPGLMTITMKRERAVISFEEALLEELFAIDSRKWPLAVREMALLARQQQQTPIRDARPESSGSSARPRSASSSRPSTQPKLMESRPAFCSSGQSGRLFTDMTVSRPQSKNCKQNPAGGKRGPLKGRPSPCTTVKKDDLEEESIYDVLSPDRHHNYVDPEAIPNYDGGDVFCVDGEGDTVNEVIVDEIPEAAHASLSVQNEHFDPTSRPSSSLCTTRPQSASTPRHNAVYHQPSTVRELLYGGGGISSRMVGGNDAVSIRVGRKRFEAHPTSTSNVSYLFQVGGPLS